MTKKIIVGIDPDTNKSGIATYYNGELLVEALAFPALIEKLYILATLPEDVLVVVEAGWLISHHWHTKKGDNQRVTARKGNNAGRNHEVGRKIVEMCEHYGLEVIEQRPLRKCWKGRDGKITHDELNYILKHNNIKELKSSNQEKRDAALICAVHAGLKLKVKV